MNNMGRSCHTIISHSLPVEKKVVMITGTSKNRERMWLPMLVHVPFIDIFRNVIVPSAQYIYNIQHGELAWNVKH
jgi:hypothetical protein